MKMSDNYSNVDISNFCRETTFISMRNHWEKIFKSIK